MKNKLRKFITILCAIVFLCCLAGLGYILYTDWQERQVEKDVASLVAQTPDPTPTPTPAPTVTPTPEPTVMPKYEQVVAENPDTIGWLQIDGTPIDYVVMWTPQEPDKYLHIDFYGNYSNRGTLYLDEDADVQNSDNLIIYGHNMQSSAMFGDLELFASQSYWENRKLIRFDSIYQEQEFEIVASFYTRILYRYEEGFRYYQFIDAEDEDAFNEYRDFIAENRLYETGVDIEYGDQLLTLSTCSYQVANGRFVVVAKRISPDTRLHEGEEATETSAPVEIIADPAPQAAAPLAAAEHSAFSTNLILLAFALLASGCALAVLTRKKT